MSAKPRQSKSTAPERNDKRLHVAMPVRVTTWDENKQPHVEMACTLDISIHGARLMSLRAATRPGQVLAIERSRTRVLCRVIWSGEPGSERSGQVGVRAVEVDRTLWDAELQEMAELFDPVAKDSNQGAGGHRRRVLRVTSAATVYISRMEGEEERTDARLVGKLSNISEIGCFIAGPTSLPPGSIVQVVVDLHSFELSMRGRVRHVSTRGMGIEFRQIRKGDRQFLKFWLQQLSMPFNELAVEVV